MNGYEIKTIDNKEELLNYNKDLWDIIQLSYEPIGGCKSYQNFEDFKRNLKYARVVFSEENKIIACSIYRTYANDDSKKMLAVGSDGSILGKQAVRDLIVLDIKEKDLHYWVEASGAIEHLFKKNNGYPIPNILVARILGMSEDRILLDVDGLHYSRQIGEENTFIKKAMFGFRSEEIYKKVLAEIEDYEAFRSISNNLTESSYSYSEVTKVKNAFFNIDKVLDFYQDEQIRELPPRWKKILSEAVTILKTSDAVKEFKSDTIFDYIEMGEYLLSQPTLELHSLNL